MWMNRWDVEETLDRFDPDEHPNLRAGALALNRLMRWVDSNSDGWPYWQPPSKAADKLMTLLHDAGRWDITDCTEAEVKKTFTPIKTFLTKREVDHSIVFPKPTPVAVLKERALHDVVHAAAHQIAANALNAGSDDAVDFLLSHGWSQEQIDDHVETRVLAAQRAER